MLGINHFDPRQPERVVSTLRALQAEYNAVPVFAAVEADENVHKKVSAQKPTFLKLLVEEWPDLTDSEFARMEASFLFEPEVHLQVFDEVPIVWLDSVRKLENRNENHHAKFRLQLLKNWLNGDSLHDSLDTVGMKACEVADHSCVDLERSRQFYNRIMIALQEYRGLWSFVVVGSAHTDSATMGTMASLLAEEKEMVKRHALDY